MKRIHFFSVAAALLLTGTLSADLTVYEYLPGQKVVLDTVTRDHWIWDLTMFTDMTYGEQVTAIGDLGTYGNIPDGWHMATQAEVLSLAGHGGPQIGLKFAPTDPYPESSLGRIDFASAGYQRILHVNNYQAQWGFSSILDAAASQDFGPWVSSSAPVVPTRRDRPGGLWPAVMPAGRQPMPP